MFNVMKPFTKTNINDIPLEEAHGGARFPERLGQIRAYFIIAL